MLRTVRQTHIICAALALLVFCAHFAGAQTPTDATTPLITATVTAALTSDGVRFAALAETKQMRLEVYTATGEQVFDSGWHAGALLDWKLKDGKSPLPDGSYVCIVTYGDLQNHLRQKFGSVAFESGVLGLKALDTEQLRLAQSHALSTAQQTQAIDPATDGNALTILPDSTPAIAVVTHDGQDGQLTSTSGDLTFRTGDIFSGKDVEQMRLTAEGNLGLGTASPQARLDVAGTIRARGGLVFDDGSALTSAGRAGRVNGSGDVVPNAAGTGTQNFIAKWTETAGAGTLGDSALYESGGKVGIGTTTPPHPLSVRQNGGTAGVNTLGELYVDRDNNTRSASMILGTAGTLKWIFGMPYQSDGFQIFDLPANQSRLFVNPTTGNIGIGTTVPSGTQKLDVAGGINTSTYYNIGGQRVLNTPGLNTFVGAAAGLNTTGTHNTFAGFHAGLGNGSGNGNSFFGAYAGDSNATGINNAFFGDEAGKANTSGAGSSFFGYHAGTLDTIGGNSYFGALAGAANTSGDRNAFFGNSAGLLNATTSNNSFFGYHAGIGATASHNSFFGSGAGDSNTSGSNNSFFGSGAGDSNGTGGSNVFIGYNAGQAVTSGNGNTFVGTRAGDTSTTATDNTYIGRYANGTVDLSNMTAIGTRARVTQANSLVLGSISGVNGATADAYVGIGVTNPIQPLQVGGLLWAEGIVLPIATEPGMCVAIFGRSNGDILLNKQSCLYGNDGRTGNAATISGGKTRFSQSLLDNASGGAGASVESNNSNTRLADALKPQQEQIKQQQAQIEGLKKLVCQDHPDADVCK